MATSSASTDAERWFGPFNAQDSFTLQLKLHTASEQSVTWKLYYEQQVEEGENEEHYPQNEENEKLGMEAITLRKDPEENVTMKSMYRTQQLNREWRRGQKETDDLQPLSSGKELISIHLRDFQRHTGMDFKILLEDTIDRKMQAFTDQSLGITSVYDVGAFVELLQRIRARTNKYTYTNKNKEYSMQLATNFWKQRTDNLWTGLWDCLLCCDLVAIVDLVGPDNEDKMKSKLLSQILIDACRMSPDLYVERARVEAMPEGDKKEVVKTKLADLEAHAASQAEHECSGRRALATILRDAWDQHSGQETTAEQTEAQNRRFKIVQRHLDSWHWPGCKSRAETIEALYLPFEGKQSKNLIEKYRKMLLEKRALIFEGPPGSGKTYFAKTLAAHFAPQSNIKTVQFSPSYEYVEFVRGYKPVEPSGFKLEPATLFTLAEKAKQKRHQVFILIIDEINRG